MKSNRRIIILTVIFGLLTASVVYAYLVQLKTGGSTGQTAAVVVAKQDIPAFTKVTQDMVEIQKMPGSAIHPAAFRTIDSVVGKTATTAIVAGEQVLTERVAQNNSALGFAGQVPQGKRAVTVAVDDVTGVAGFLEPGNKVDVLATFDKNTAGTDKTRQVLQNLTVLAVGSHYLGGQASDAAQTGKTQRQTQTQTVTLAVTPAEGETLTLAAEVGKIRLMLRPPHENRLTKTTGITPQRLMDSGK